MAGLLIARRPAVPITVFAPSRAIHAADDYTQASVRAGEKQVRAYEVAKKTPSPAGKSVFVKSVWFRLLREPPGV